jgi:DNA topoisomerase VI subunit B
MKTLERVAFRTSRLLEFCSERELTTQTGHSKADWPLVIEKELVDNALDGCEEAKTAPEIEIEVDTESGEIVVADNGPGIPSATVRDLLDYTARVSSREAYVSPTRGAQGNALKTLLAMPFVLDGKTGTTVIETRAKRHRVTFRVDCLRQQPAINHEVTPLPSCKNGTRISIAWPNSACCSVLESAEQRFLQIADDFGWLNPHLKIAVKWNGVERLRREPSNSAWQKWAPSAPTSAWWYDADQLERYIGAHICRDLDRRRDRTIREFIGELRGFSGSAKQKAVLDATGLARAALSSLFNAAGEPDKATIAVLLAALKTHSKPVKPQDLGLIGKEHLRARFNEIGLEPETFIYQKAVDYADDGLPWVVETAFGWCPGLDQRPIICGVNWSVGLGNPFRSLKGGEGLEAVLAKQWAGRDEPVAFLLHYACPRAAYTDRGKSAVIFPGQAALRPPHAMGV